MAERDCIFCDRKKVAPNILYERDKFYTAVGFGLSGPGHSMLISNSHLRCFGELPEGLDREYEQAKQDLARRVESEFNTPTLIEYGIWGQTVPHAHTHFIPRIGPGFGITSFIDEMVIPGGIEVEEVSGIDMVFCRKRPIC